MQDRMRVEAHSKFALTTLLINSSNIAITPFSILSSQRHELGQLVLLCMSYAEDKSAEIFESTLNNLYDIIEDAPEYFAYVDCTKCFFKFSSNFTIILFELILQYVDDVAKCSVPHAKTDWRPNLSDRTF